MWGLYEREDEIHVIPCHDDGTILAPHLVDDLCQCRPEIVEVGEDGRLIISHNQIQ